MPAHIQHLRTREAILDATDLLLSRSGFKKMTIEDLAREVGIGKGSSYMHFESKDEIALSHIDRIVERLKVRLRVIVDGPGTASERVHEMLVERVLYRSDSVQHYSHNLGELLSCLRTKLPERRQRYFNDEALIFADVLIAGSESGEFAPTDAHQTASALLEATNSLLPYSLSPRELNSRSELSARVTSIATILIKGLGR